MAVGAYAFPLPEVLAAALGVGVFWFVCELLMPRRSRTWIIQRLPRNPLTLPFHRHTGVAVLLFAELCGFGSWYFLHERFEKRLWSTGQFGEPPNNRAVILRGVGSDPPMALVEWQARSYPIEGLNVLAVFQPPAVNPQTVQFWFGPPGLKFVPSQSERDRPWGAVSGSVSEAHIRYRHEGYGITPERSFYASFSPASNTVLLLGCYLRSHLETQGKLCHEEVKLSSETITLEHATP